ncbi:MAG TPA: hypothetical protein VH858_12625 [Hyphomicrobiales bacterium]|jgi:hypothetical protein
MRTLKAGALAVVATALLSSAAEAKLMRYIIDGKTYSYSTNNDAQTREAEGRMAAARRAGSEVKVAHSFREWKRLQGAARNAPKTIEAARPAARHVPDAEVTASVRQASPRPPAGIAETRVSRGPGDAAVRAITFDLRSGIKTIHRHDGSVHEEPFDAAELQRLSSVVDRGPASAPPARSGLDGFVDQLRRPASH